MIELNEHSIDGISTIAHYQLQRLLARGGMSQIYLAHDAETQHTVAIKLVHSDAGDYCTRFQREVKAIATLHHDHILPAFDYGEQDSWCYMAMPYIEGGTLKHRISQGRIPLKEAERLFTQLADAVQFAHDHGILHRDIKPSNILLRDSEHVYLTDFGLVRNVEEESHITGTGYVIGTPEYLAPEQVEHSATPGSDVYALGIVLYEMLTGRVPFKGSSPLGTCWKHVHEQPVAPSTLNPMISAETEKVMLRALEKDPTRRYQSAQELALAFQESLSATTLSSANTLALPEDTVAMQTASHRTGKVHPGMFALVALLMLFILPTSLGFMLSRTYSFKRYNQAPTMLGASGSFFNGQLSGKPPTHPTPQEQTSPVVTPVNTASTSNHYGSSPVSTPSTGGSNQNNSHRHQGNGNDNGNGNGNGHKNDNGHKHGNGNGNGNGKNNGGGKNGGDNNNSVQGVVIV